MARKDNTINGTREDVIMLNEILKTNSVPNEENILNEV